MPRSRLWSLLVDMGNSRVVSVAIRAESKRGKPRAKQVRGLLDRLVRSVRYLAAFAWLSAEDKDAKTESATAGIRPTRALFFVMPDPSSEAFPEKSPKTVASAPSQYDTTGSPARDPVRRADFTVSILGRLIMLGMVLAVAVAALVGAEEKEASPQEQLRAWGEDFVGTWASEESTLETDVAGLGKKGDKISTLGTIKPANGIYQITWETQINGKLTTAGMAIVGWDPSRKKVTARLFNKHGGTATFTYTKRGDKWHTRGISIEPDGTKSSDTAVLTVTDTTHTYELSNRKRGEESLPDKEQVWTKQ